MGAHEKPDSECGLAARARHHPVGLNNGECIGDLDMSSEHGDNRNEGDAEDKGGMERVEFTVVVSGTPVTFKENADKPLNSVIDRALKKTGNVGQPADSWELRDEQGVFLDPSRTIESYGFGKAVKLFLTLKAGVGGNR